MTRYCPKCGEPVPSNCITCPKCYTKIPPEPIKAEETTGETGTKRTSSGKLRMALAIIPGFFGVLGLGQIYRDHTSFRGYFFLIVGLILFLSGNALLLSLIPDLILGILKTIVGVGLLLLYLLLFIISVIDALAGSSVVVRR